MSVPFWTRLEAFAGAPALLREEGAPLSYAALAREADAFAARLPREPQLIALEAGNHVAPIAAYLGCLRAGHPVILVNEAALAEGRILSLYQPNWIYRRDGDEWRLHRFSEKPAALHPDLAVLLSTSGTTGAPKLVRLSRENIASNAEAIASYLGLTPQDRAITSLEFAYSFGMAAMNAQFAIGGALVLTEQPIVNEAFWDRFRDAQASLISLVPYHVDVLERLNFAERDLPSLRFLCQAGGRLAPELAQKYERLAKKRGFKFFVMYGQTEASPRMAFVPPEDLAANSDCIGRAIPGGAFLLRDSDGEEIVAANAPGELIYRGLNVMLGYAEARADLAKGREIEELATGDVAMRTAQGYFKIVGRLKRFVKIYGLRINLDEVEAQARAAGYPSYCSGNDEMLALFHTDAFDQDALRQWASARYGLRREDVLVERLEAAPLLSSGKVDYAALKQRVRAPLPANIGKTASVMQAFRAMFPGRELSPRDSFASLGGDSLAYVSLMLEVEKALGHVPRDWERMEIGALERVNKKPGAFSDIPMESLLRVLAITTIITEHLGILPVYGGAWALMMLVGYTAFKFSRERLAAGQSWSVLARNLGRVLVLYYAIMTLYFLTQDTHEGADPAAWFLLYANFTPMLTYLIVYWFICAYAQIMLLTSAAWAIAPLRKWFAGAPARFGYAALALGVCTAAAAFFLFSDTQAFDKNLLTILPIFALGWCIGAARSGAARRFVSFTAIAITGLFALFWFVLMPPENAFTAAIKQSSVIYLPIASLILIWVDRITLPKLLAKAVVVIAAASFYIYLLHLIPMHILNAMWAPRESVSLFEKWALGISSAFALGLIAKAVMDWVGPKAEDYAGRAWRSLRGRASAVLHQFPTR